VSPLDPARHHGRLLAAATLAGLIAIVAGCGSSGPPPPWRSGHPDPGSLSLLSSGQAGSCAAAAPYPDQAPAAIDLQGKEYVQKSRQPAQAQPPGGVEIDHTGDWAFFDDPDGSLTVTTPQADFLYVAGSC